MNKGRIIEGVNLYWIGPRESDIEAVKEQFVGSITFFGDGNSEGYGRAFDGKELATRGNHTIPRDVKVDHNDMDATTLDKHVYDSVLKIIAEDPNAKFLMYNANVIRPHTKSSIGKKLTDEDRKALFLLDEKTYRERYICLNSNEIMEAMDSKKSFHQIISKIITDDNLLEIQQIDGQNIDSYSKLCQRFDVDPFSGVRFIVQENFASGGAGTHIVSRAKHEERLSFKHNETYIVSVLQENSISVNTHIIVFDDKILLLPGSIQIIRENNKRLMYRGADFITYRDIDKKLREKFEELAVIIAAKYQSGVEIEDEDGISKKKIDGFRGVLGIDAIIHGGKVKMLECNNRFQSSSNLLNYALNDNGMPSLQEMCYLATECDGEGYATFEKIMAKHGEGALLKCKATDNLGNQYDYSKIDIDVNYSNFSFVDSGSNIIHAKRMYAVASHCVGESESKGFLGYTPPNNNWSEYSHIYKLESDGYRPELSYKAYSHLFRVSFNAPITAISPEGTLRVNENIVEADSTWSDLIYDFDPLETKIALMTQGVNIDCSKDTLECLEKLGGYREATNEAIDIYLHRPNEISTPNYIEMVVNAPLDVDYIPFSPFSLKANKGRLWLYYYNTAINDNIELFRQDPLADKLLPCGHKYSEVAFLSGDRLRVHVTNTCRFKKDDGVGCRFCNMKNGDIPCDHFDPEIIRQVVTDYLSLDVEYRIDHFLVGGQSPIDPDWSATISVVETIHSIAPNKHIYLMSLPPKKKEDILRLAVAGVTEFSFNIELYSQNYAERYMPGKATLCARNDYLNALNIARFVMDDDNMDCVRTMFIVGLEPIASLRQGVRLMINNGIQPMLSIFRPLPGTECVTLLPPSMKELYNLYNEFEAWCREKGLHLGPSDIFCQNNTLSLPY